MTPTFIAICLWLAVTDAISIILSYKENIKDTWWGLGAVLSVGVVQSINWCVVLKISKSDNELMMISCIWEIIQTVVFFAIPIIAFDVKLTALSLAGLAIMAAGFACVRMGTN